MNHHFANVGDVMKHLALICVAEDVRPSRYLEAHAGGFDYAMAEREGALLDGVWDFLRAAETVGILDQSAFARLLRNIAPAGPALTGALDGEFARPGVGKRQRRFRRAILPLRPLIRTQDHRHPVMHLGHRRAAVGHDHRVGIAPLGGRSPQAGDREWIGAGQPIQGPRHPPGFAFCLGPLTDRDQAASPGETVAPERSGELVIAGVGDGLGFQLAAIPALENERIAPGHRSRPPLGNDQPGIAGVKLGGGIGAG